MSESTAALSKLSTNDYIALDVDVPDSVYEGLQERFEKEAKETGLIAKFIVVTGQKTVQ